MQVIDILSERKDDTTSLGNSIVAILKKTPSVKKPLEQFKNDPNKFHSTARSRFRTWATRSGLSYVQTNGQNLKRLNQNVFYEYSRKSRKFLKKILNSDFSFNLKRKKM